PNSSAKNSTRCRCLNSRNAGLLQHSPWFGAKFRERASPLLRISPSPRQSLPPHHQPLQCNSSAGGPARNFSCSSSDTSISRLDVPNQGGVMTSIGFRSRLGLAVVLVLCPILRADFLAIYGSPPYDFNSGGYQG